MFDQIHGDRVAIEEAMGQPLSWERLEDKRASRVAVYHPGGITDSESELAQLQSWAADAVPRFYSAMKVRAEEALREAGLLGS